MKHFYFVGLFVCLMVLTIVNSQECIDGDVKLENCNTCRCLNGAYACTRKLCGGIRREKREFPVAADLKNTPCAPNDYFKIDCNTCYCNLERTGYLCTENFCSDDTQIPEKSEINLSADTKVVITNGNVQLVKNNVTTLIDNNLSRVGNNRALNLTNAYAEGESSAVTENSTVAVVENVPKAIEHNNLTESETSK